MVLPGGPFLLPRWDRQRFDPPHHSPESPSRQMTFCPQQAALPCVLDQSPAGLHQPLLQTRQRSVSDSAGQRQAPPQVAQQAQALQQEFLGEDLSSRVLGFYTWSDELSRVFRRDSMLQTEIKEPTARAFVTALSRNEETLATSASASLQ